MGAWDEFETPDNDGPNYWKPEAPEKLRGKIVGFDKKIDDEDDTKVFPVLILEVDGDEVIVTGFRKLLSDALLTLVKVDGAKVGDEVEVTYGGKAPGKRYFLYSAKLIGAAPKREVDAKEEF